MSRVLSAVAWLLAVMWSRSAMSAARRSEARLRGLLDAQVRARVDAQHALAARLRVLESCAAAESWPFVTAEPSSEALEAAWRVFYETPPSSDKYERAVRAAYKAEAARCVARGPREFGETALRAADEAMREEVDLHTRLGRPVSGRKVLRAALAAAASS